MPTTSFVKFLLRRDFATAIDTVTLSLGEPAICTDTHEIRIGDGVTPGGYQVGFENPLTTWGDLMIGTTAGVPTRVAIGSPGLALIVNTAGTGYRFGQAGGGSTLTRAITVTTATGNQDDFNIGDASVLFCNNATTLTIRGITGGMQGRDLLVVPIGAGAVYLNHASTHSATANRLDTRFPVTFNSLIIAASGSSRLFYDATNSKWIVVDWSSGVPTGVMNYTELTRAADQTTNSGSAAYISFDTEVSNAWGVFSSGNPTRLTIPPGQGGLWMFNAHFYFNQSITGIVQFGMRKNGSTFMFASDVKAEGTCQHVLTTALQLAAGDYVEFYGYQASGSDKTIRMQAFTCFRAA